MKTETVLTANELTQQAIELTVIQRRAVAVQAAEAFIKRVITHASHLKLLAGVEDRIADALVPFFESQIKSMSDNLSDMDGDKSIKEVVDDTATKIVEQIFNPVEWTPLLINIMLPVLAVEMARVGVAQMAEMGVDIRGTA